MALINLFVKLWNNLVQICNNGNLQTVSNVIFHIFNLNMDK